MKKCKSCGKEFHYHTSCEFDMYMLAGYCSKKCWQESYEYKIFLSRLKTFWNSLNEKQKSDLWSLWDNGILIDDIWEDTIDDIWKM